MTHILKTGLLCTMLCTMICIIVNTSFCFAGSDSIESLTQQINDLEYRKGNIHTFADQAREDNFAVTDFVIMSYSTMWHDLDKQEQVLQTKLAGLLKAKAIEDAKFAAKQEQIAKASRGELRDVKLIDGEKCTYVGNYRITYYCPCEKCCGAGAHGITASGAKAIEGVTVAASGNLKFGTKVYIEGVGYRIVQDRGSAVNGNHIDVFVSNHAACFEQTYLPSTPVYIVK